MLYRTYYVFVIYLTLFILLTHLKPNKSELGRKSCAEFSGFMLHGIGGERTVEAAGTGQSGTKTFAEMLEKLSCASAPCPSQTFPVPWGTPAVLVLHPHSHAQREKPTDKLQNV